ncbi:hypothetical protein II582_02665 [bacterium]|nr:hypothetical protein [bacterium]
MSECSETCVTVCDTVGCVVVSVVVVVQLVVQPTIEDSKLFSSETVAHLSISLFIFFKSSMC